MSHYSRDDRGRPDDRRDDRGYGGRSDDRYGGRTDDRRDDRGYGGRPDDRSNSRPDSRGGNGGRYEGGRGNSGGRFDGGRGGGRFDGGRGGGRFDGGRGGRGGRGGGKNRQMGDIPSVSSLIRQVRESDILAVISPPDADRYRNPNRPRMPPVESWRLGSRVGVQLLGGPHVIKANHFALTTNKIPSQIFHYHVHMNKYVKGVLEDTDCVVAEDAQTCVSIMISLRKKHPEWETLPNGNKLACSYDGKSALYTSHPLQLVGENGDGKPSQSDDAFLLNEDGSESKKCYRLTLTLIETIVMPAGGGDSQWAGIDQNVLRALDASLLSFAKWDLSKDRPDWYLVGTKMFRANSSAVSLAPGYVSMRGYYAGLKSCLAGLVLVSDMSVNCFLKGGNMTDVVAAAGNLRSFDELLSLSQSRDGINSRLRASINEVIKGCKLRLTHIHHSKKAKSLGPAASSRDSEFVLDDKKITVAEYFALMAKDPTKALYRAALPDGQLKYPTLPTINVGSEKKPILVPMELCFVPGGQSRSKRMTGEMTAQIIKQAAVRPAERFKFLTEAQDSHNTSIVNVLRTIPTTAAFGLSEISPEPMSVPATILPQAKLQYQNDQIADPGISGEWRQTDRMKFACAPPVTRKEGYMYGVLMVGESEPRNWQKLLDDFFGQMERDAGNCGLQFKKGGPPMAAPVHFEMITNCLIKMKSAGVRVVFVILCSDCYPLAKRAGDTLGVTTQCLKWKNIERSPRGYHTNVMLKVNTKMGGTNHTLISRLPAGANAPATFQKPPASISWLFDKTCMLVGVDVSHPDPGSDRESMAAVVGSMDGCASQYVAHISAQASRVEMVSALEEGMISLLNCFKQRNNGVLPASIVVYRDGVSDSQFDAVLTNELPGIKEALLMCGDMKKETKVSIVICQKGHHTRLSYEEKQEGDISYINPCPGLVVDANGGEKSIASGKYNEFYLNSHIAIQGTAKPCKYSLVYDEIGFKMSELELLSYWTCYLYCRCNRSVSYATPAYYAHWAARRARTLVAAGTLGHELAGISNAWSTKEHSTMFFV